MIRDYRSNLNKAIKIAFCEYFGIPSVPKKIICPDIQEIVEQQRKETLAVFQQPTTYRNEDDQVSKRYVVMMMAALGGKDLTKSRMAFVDYCVRVCLLWFGRNFAKKFLSFRIFK